MNKLNNLFEGLFKHFERREDAEKKYKHTERGYCELHRTVEQKIRNDLKKVVDGFINCEFSIRRTEDKKPAIFMRVFVNTLSKKDMFGLLDYFYENGFCLSHIGLRDCPYEPYEGKRICFYFVREDVLEGDNK